MEQKVFFAPLPLGAIGDTRLTSLHLRTLACIAFHDRLSGPRRKGQGAWASLDTLSKRIRCHYTSASTAISELVDYGYLIKERHQFDGRRHVYRVIYDSLDDRANPADSVMARDSLADEKALSAGQGDIHAELRERMKLDAYIQAVMAAGSDTDGLGPEKGTW